MGRAVLNRMERYLAIRALEMAVEETRNWPSRHASTASKISDGGTQPGAGPGRIRKESGLNEHLERHENVTPTIAH
ncbi:hypothetical protein [Epibacterium ulvae]|uniref:hypothetical protein n=1 Tax=Epibacterium ulvae TaxID=1156985 RepID=UPI00248F5F43|nr:hypothetical protein [Epibacterium ulvae]